MATKQIQLDVVTPERIVFSEKVDFFIVHSTAGELGVLPNHAPLLASLEPSILYYNKADHDSFIAVMGGFLEVKDNQATVLSDAAEPAGGIDALRARLEADKAEALKLQKSDDVQYAMVEADLQRILLQLKALDLINSVRKLPR